MHARKRVTNCRSPARTRWTVYDPVADVFHVNIAAPAQIVVVGAPIRCTCSGRCPSPRPAPIGYDLLDAERRRLLCACDAGVLLKVRADSGEVLTREPIAGVPDVVFFNQRLRRLYVAIGEPGVIEVFDTAPLRRHEIVATEVGR